MKDPNKLGNMNNTAGNTIDLLGAALSPLGCHNSPTAGETLLFGLAPGVKETSLTRKENIGLL